MSQIGHILEAITLRDIQKRTMDISTRTQGFQFIYGVQKDAIKTRLTHAHC